MDGEAAWTVWRGRVLDGVWCEGWAYWEQGQLGMGKELGGGGLEEFCHMTCNVTIGMKQRTSSGNQMGWDQLWWGQIYTPPPSPPTHTHNTCMRACLCTHARTHTCTHIHTHTHTQEARCDLFLGGVQNSELYYHYQHVPERPHSWPSSPGCRSDWQLGQVVWSYLPPCGAQTPLPDAAALHRVHPPGEVLASTSRPDEHLHCGPVCAEGENHISVLACSRQDFVKCCFYRKLCLFLFLKNRGKKFFSSA